MRRPDWDSYFLAITYAVSDRADCRRRKCGAVIVKDHRIISTGYNGAPSKEGSCLDGDCPRGLMTIEELGGYQEGNHDYSNCIGLHAEMNAIAYANGRDCVGATIYITHPPCDNCAKVIKAAGITKVVWNVD